MRIALIILHADGHRGGAERYTLDLAASLASRAEQPTIIAADFADAPRGVSCVRLKAEAWTKLGQYERFLDLLDGHLAESRYDVVHAMLPVRNCQIYHPHAGLAIEGVTAASFKHSTEVVRRIARFINRQNRKRRRFAEVEKQLLSGAKAPLVLCLSQYVKQTIRRHYSIDDSRLATLHNGIDLARFDPGERPDAGRNLRDRLGLAGDAVVALMVGHDFVRKGVRQAVEAVARVNDPRLVLLVAGKDDAAPYQKLAAELGVSRRVIFAGPTDDPYGFYQSADFLVQPTHHDPCSLVVIEALAMGLPVISTAHNGACELMTDGREGYILADAGDVARLAEAMAKMLDAGERFRMYRACLSLRPRLSERRHVDELMAIYQQMKPR